MIYGETPPAFSLSGTRERAGGRPAGPGPGDYTVEKDLLDSPPRTVFGRAAKAHLSRSMSPGPGAYKVPDTIGTGPKYHLSSRPDSKLNRLSTPGPGAYDIKLTDRQLRYSFGGGPTRLLSYGMEGPGPGAYAPDSVLKSAPKYKYCLPSFPKATRNPSPSRTSVPGPHDYSPKPALDDAPRWTFTRSYRQGQTSSPTPGPGAYSLMNSTLQTIGPSFSPKRTNDAFDEGPGPGAYEMAKTFAGEMPAFSLGKSPREAGALGRTSPSPAHYSPKPVHRALPAYTIAQERRSFDVKNASLPGPGQYDPKSPDSQASISLSSRHKDLSQTLKSSIPVLSTQGPGHYSVTTHLPNRRAPQPVFGSAKRPDLVGKERRPAPTDYQIRRELEGPKFTIPKAKPGEELRTGPGPGSYSPPAAIGSVNRYGVKH